MGTRRSLLFLTLIFAQAGAACDCGASGTVGQLPDGNNLPFDAGWASDGGSDGGPDGGGDAGPGLDDGGDGGAGHPGDGGCGLRTCAKAGAQCGFIGDGCGGVLDCGGCTGAASCGGGGVPFACGGNDGCLAKTCQSLGYGCGPASDGCGGVLDCGACDAGSCGGGGTRFACGGGGNGDGDGGDGGGGLCRPLSCASERVSCGLIGDGCGNLLPCGACDAGSCGGAGRAGVCGVPGSTCRPLTCAAADAGCGNVGDGCGGSLFCGGCDSGICGGGGIPNVCGTTPDGGRCTNLCLQQDLCDAGATISGTVYAPTNPDAGFGPPDPLPGALVYIPNAAVQPFTDGVTCAVCGAPASGDPLVQATSFEDGGFQLIHVPTGSNIPLVIQLGRWRRQITLPQVSCGENVLSASQTRLPRNQREGDIPKIAMVTGNVDSLECVLRKMGVDDGEFTSPDGGGRVQIYVSDSDGGLPDAGVGGASDPSGYAPKESVLTSSLSTLENYDLVLLACVGKEVAQPAASQQNLVDYTSAGGRVYATHYSYVWLFDNPPFDTTANWNTGNGRHDPIENVTIDNTFAKGQEMSDWMSLVGAAVSPGVIPLGYLRNDYTTAVVPPSENWLSWQPPPDGGQTNPAPWPIHYTFNTPLGADGGAECGRVVFSDFHVENANGNFGSAFPKECTAGPLTPQEKVLEFMLFDLSSCVVQSNPGPACAPLTCAQQGYACGAQGNGCGAIIQCGSCDAGSCGGGGVPGQCGGACVPFTCQSLGLTCGPAADGCGGLLQCGGCDAGSCGGGGRPGVCGAPPDAGGCQPLTCSAQHLQCGPAGDGCGLEIQCGGCDAGTCGGGGVAGQCGVPPCTKLTCAGLGYDCGATGDGCGGLLQCGTCDAGSCGGSFAANQCGQIQFH